MQRHLSVYGDSIAYGVGAPPGYGFVPVLATILAQRERRRQPYLNFGVSGMTSIQLASAFYGLDAWLAGLHRATSICIYIGGDDIIADVPALLTQSRQAIQTALLQSQRAYQSILQTALHIAHCPVVVGTIYNPFPNTELAEVVISTFNDVVIHNSATRFQVPVAPIHDAFSGNQAQLIAGYQGGVLLGKSIQGRSVPVHPNARGHRVIADVFAKSLQ